jgi:hypothetical protein
MNDNKGYGCLYAIIGIVVFLFILGTISDKCSSSTNNNSGSSCSGTKPTTYAQASVRMYLRNNYLKDPESYKAISWDVSESSGGSYKYIVRHKFRAKNSFGGYVVENGMFYLDSNYNVIYFDIY